MKFICMFIFPIFSFKVFKRFFEGFGKKNFLGEIFLKKLQKYFLHKTFYYRKNINIFKGNDEKY